MPPARRRTTGPKPPARPVEQLDEQAAKPKILATPELVDELMPAPVSDEAVEETCVLGEGGRVVELDPTCPTHGHGHVEAFCPTPSICWPYGVPAGVAHAVCIHGEHKYSG